MTTPSYNPEQAALAIPFVEDFRGAQDSVRFVRFGPIAGKQRFDVVSVVDAVSGLNYPLDALRFEDAGPDGVDHRRVAVIFDGTLFAKHLRTETADDNFLERLRDGLKYVYEKLPNEDSAKRAKLEDILDVYNKLVEKFSGTYEPLFAALTTGSALAIKVRFTDASADVDPADNDCEGEVAGVGGHDQDHAAEVRLATVVEANPVEPPSATIVILPRPVMRAAADAAAVQSGSSKAIPGAS